MITVGQLREELATYPDDTPIAIEHAGNLGVYVALAEIVHSERIDRADLGHAQGAHLDLFGAYDCDMHQRCDHTDCRWSNAVPVILLLPERDR